MFSTSKITKEKCTQVYFRDDRQFTFRVMPVEDGFINERQNEKIHRSWMYPYRVLKHFNGYGSLKRGMIILSYGRDIILDPFYQLGTDEMPKLGPEIVKTQIAAIGTGVLYTHLDSKKRTSVDRMVNTMSWVLVILALTVAIVALRGSGG